jgi:hypothetical protein
MSKHGTVASNVARRHEPRHAHALYFFGGRPSDQRSDEEGGHGRQKNTRHVRVAAHAALP